MPGIHASRARGRRGEKFEEGSFSITRTSLSGKLGGEPRSYLLGLEAQAAGEDSSVARGTSEEGGRFG